MLTCEECNTSIKRAFPGFNGMKLCQSCFTELQESISKPKEPDYESTRKAIPTVSDIVTEGRKRAEPDVIQYLRKLTRKELAEEMSYAASILQIASGLYESKALAESQAQKETLRQEHKTLMVQWHEKQRSAELEKRIHSLRGIDRKIYNKTGQFIDDAVKEFAERLRKEVKV